MNGKHSPLPWSIHPIGSEGVHIKVKNPTTRKEQLMTIAKVYDGDWDEIMGNAQLIVRAVNDRERLVEALTVARKAIVAGSNVSGGEDWDPWAREITARLLAKIDAALSTEGGE